jgi:hypothetical protein
LSAAFCRELIEAGRPEPTSALLCCGWQLRRNGEVETRVKSNDFADDSKVAIELTDLTAQLGEAICQLDGIARVVGVKKAIDRGLDKRGFRDSTALGRRCQSRRSALGEIDANPRFHVGTR